MAIFSVLAVVVVFVAGLKWKPMQAIRERMLAQWKAALTITVVFLVSYGLGEGFNRRIALGAIAFFCQSLLGLAVARSISGFEPLPVTQAITRRERAWRNVFLMIIIALVMVPVGLISGSLGMSMGERVFGETRVSIDMGTFESIVPSNPWLAFLLFLAGGGIAEETMFRLLLLSFLWRLTRRRWLAIILSAMLFGAYHLSPINRMAHIFWQFPVSQFLSSTLGGLVFGYLYVKRGYETTVLTHTLENWIPFALSALLQQGIPVSIGISGNILMIVGGVLGAAVLTLFVASLAWVYRDAQARSSAGGPWVLIALITWPFGILVYMVLRKREAQGIEETEIALSDRLLAALSWMPVSPLWPIGAILVLLVRSTRSRPFIRYNALHSIITGLIIILLTIVLVGLAVLLYFAFLYPDYSIKTATIPSVLLFLPFFYWAYQALRGKTVRVPLVSDWMSRREWVQLL